MLKHPNAKDDWASSADVGGEFGSHSVSLIIGILQSLSSNAFPTGLMHYVHKGVTLRTSYARYKCMGVLYYKLVAFIPNTKDV
ncbi:SsrA-binding protein [Helicobacter pylori]